jgi:hypothetical protein
MRVLFEGQDISKRHGRLPQRLRLRARRSSSLHYLSGLEYLQLVGRLRGLDEALIEAKATTPAQAAESRVVAIFAHLFLLEGNAPAGADRRGAAARSQTADLR